MGLADARDLARKVFRQVAEGRDPATDKQVERHEEKSFGDLSKEYMERHAKAKKRSWRADQWMINRHLIPAWRNVKAREISRPSVRALVEAIADKGTPILANRVLALASKIFSFAVQRDWRPDNPCNDIERPGIERTHDKVLSDAEIASLWGALETEDLFVRALFRLRLLTGARGGEVRHMRWADIDLETGWWTIPPEVAKNGIAHRVPLIDKAVELLTALNAHQSERLRQINAGRLKKKWVLKEPSAWVFASPRGDGPFEWEQRLTDRLRLRSGIRFRPHDLRRTVGTALTQHCRVDRFILKRILNHVDRDVTGVYDRNRYDNEKRVALEAWGRRLDAIVRNVAQESSVVPMVVGQR